MEVSKEWLKKYKEKIKIMCPENNLEKYFTDKEIAGHKLDTIHMGKIKITSGDIIVCDPVEFLSNDNYPFFDKFPTGEFDVTASLIIDEEDENIGYTALVKIQFTDEKPVLYREALYGDENLDEINEQGDFFGVPLFSGRACIIDRDGAEKLAQYIIDNEEKDENFDIFADVYSDKLTENAKKYPKYQNDEGSWVNMNVPESNDSMVIFSTNHIIDEEFSDEYFPVYVAEDKNGNICQLVVQFIDVELSDDDYDDIDELDD